MDQWINYYDTEHTIYVSKRHRDVHFRIVADDIIGFISSPASTVLDYSCGEALFAGDVAGRCAKLILAEPAPSVRGYLTARFAQNPKIEVRSLDDLAQLPGASVDLAVVNSVAQYMTPDELDTALSLIHRLLKPGGRLVLGDILQPQVGPVADVAALLKLAARHGFVIDAVIGLARTALSDYRRLRQSVGLQHYDEAAMLTKLPAAGFSAVRAPRNVGYNPARMTFIATRPA